MRNNRLMAVVYGYKECLIIREHDTPTSLPSLSPPCFGMWRRHVFLLPSHCTMTKAGCLTSSMKTCMANACKTSSLVLVQWFPRLPGCNVDDIVCRSSMASCRCCCAEQAHWSAATQTQTHPICVSMMLSRNASVMPPVYIPPSVEMSLVYVCNANKKKTRMRAVLRNPNPPCNAIQYHANPCKTESKNVKKKHKSQAAPSRESQSQMFVVCQRPAHSEGETAGSPCALFLSNRPISRANTTPDVRESNQSGSMTL